MIMLIKLVHLRYYNSKVMSSCISTMCRQQKYVSTFYRTTECKQTVPTDYEYTKSHGTVTTHTQEVNECVTL